MERKNIDTHDTRRPEQIGSSDRGSACEFENLREEEINLAQECLNKPIGHRSHVEGMCMGCDSQI